MDFNFAHEIFKIYALPTFILQISQNKRVKENQFESKKPHFRLHNVNTQTGINKIGVISLSTGVNRAYILSLIFNALTALTSLTFSTAKIFATKTAYLQKIFVFLQRISRARNRH